MLDCLLIFINIYPYGQDCHANQTKSKSESMNIENGITALDCYDTETSLPFRCMSNDPKRDVAQILGEVLLIM